MIKHIDGIMLGSDNAEKLAEFYRDVVGLKQVEEFEMENGDKSFSFDLGNIDLIIGDHSEVKGTNKNPERIFLNFEVDNIEKEAQKLEKKGVKLKQEIYHVEGYGLIATFIDPDGNFFQLVQVKAVN